VPTILSILEYQALDAPALVFAAAAHPDPEEAVRKSLDELAHTRRFAQALKSEQPAVVTDPDFDRVVDQDCHVNLFCDHANVGLADFIFSSNEQIDFREIESCATGDVGDDLKIIGENIGHTALLVDVTSEDVRGLGLSVIRAVIPGCHPLFMGHRLRALGGSRLWEVPRKLGYQGISSESEANPAPHPYP
jgi:ribosomal protein S12 methylthiotransferase accessory factor